MNTKVIVIFVTLAAGVFAPVLAGVNNYAVFCFIIVLVILMLAWMFSKKEPRTPPPDMFDGSTLKLIRPPAKRKKH